MRTIPILTRHRFSLAVRSEITRFGEWISIRPTGLYTVNSSPPGRLRAARAISALIFCCFRGSMSPIVAIRPPSMIRRNANRNNKMSIFESLGISKSELASCRPLPHKKHFVVIVMVAHFYVSRVCGSLPALNCNRETKITCNVQ